MPEVPIAPVLCEPVAALLPLHEPPAVQLVGLFVALHVIVALLPAVMLTGDTEILILGVAITVSVVDAEFVPALLVHESEYV